MAFTRKALTGLGLSEELVEKVMTLHGTSMSDFIPKTELQTKINEAVEQAKKDAPAPNIMESAEYRELLSERDMLRALGSDDFAGVKPKFREAVYKMIDREDGAKPVEEQLKTIAADYEEYFNPAEGDKQPPNTPQFATNVTGRMPKGDTKPTLEGIWFGKK